MAANLRGVGILLPCILGRVLPLNGAGKENGRTIKILATLRHLQPRKNSCNIELVFSSIFNLNYETEPRTPKNVLLLSILSNTAEAKGGGGVC